MNKYRLLAYSETCKCKPSLAGENKIYDFNLKIGDQWFDFSVSVTNCSTIKREVELEEVTNKVIEALETLNKSNKKQLILEGIRYINK